VKQCDLGEYEEKYRRKEKYTSIQGKSTNFPTNQGKSKDPLQTKTYGWQTPNFKLKRVARNAQGFSMQKIILPLNTRRTTTSAKLNQRREFPLK
jgi:hypothetical protein